MAPRGGLNGASDTRGDDTEQCPVCQSSKYMNPHIKFLISTECYHKMCESCVDRLLQRGPRPCPIAGCKATIRRHKFRAPTFLDLSMEKEVDIRREMAKTFNKREDDFEDLRAYNDYLAMVEDMIFNLVNEIEVEATRGKVDEYRKENLRLIEQNKELEEEGSKAFKAAQKAQDEAVKERRQAALLEQEKEKQEQHAIEQEYIRKLQAGGNAAELAEERSRKLQGAAARRKEALDAIAGSGNKTQPAYLRGLKKRKEEVEAPYDPFGGRANGKEYCAIFETYPGDETFKRYEKDPKWVKWAPGGYEKEEWYRRALVDAFAGLGVFVQEEMDTSESTAMEGITT